MSLSSSFSNSCRKRVIQIRKESQLDTITVKILSKIYGLLSIKRLILRSLLSILWPLTSLFQRSFLTLLSKVFNVKIEMSKRTLSRSSLNFGNKLKHFTQDTCHLIRNSMITLMEIKTCAKRRNT